MKAPGPSGKRRLRLAVICRVDELRDVGLHFAVTVDKKRRVWCGPVPTAGGETHAALVDLARHAASLLCATPAARPAHADLTHTSLVRVQPAAAAEHAEETGHPCRRKGGLVAGGFFVLDVPLPLELDRRLPLSPPVASG